MALNYDNAAVCKDCGIAPGISSKRPYCRPCRNARDRARYSPEADRFRHIKMRYGITQVEYEAMYGAQGGKCAICDAHHKVLDVDHCHSTNRVRKLLCRACNVFLGRIESKPELLNKIFDYLEVD